jgi:hypothetical protein
MVRGNRMRRNWEEEDNKAMVEGMRRVAIMKGKNTIC